MNYALTGALVLLLATLVEAKDLVSLKDGTSYVGEVTELSATDVTVVVEYPAPETIRIPREKLTDRTLWRILSSRTKSEDAQAWLDLAVWAETRELWVPALVSYRSAAREPKLAERAGKSASAIETRLAQQLFDRGETYFVNGRPASARRYFEILISRYPETPVAPIAKIRLTQVEERLAASKSAEAAAAASAKSDKTLARFRRQWDAEVEAIQGHLRAASKARPDRIERTRPVRSGRALERAVRHLEAGWERVGDLGPPPEGVAPDDAKQLVNEVKSRLVQAYLDTGLAYLMRPSLNQAEEFCTKACDLDPENAATHALHEKIIYARLYSDWDTGGWFSPRRR